MSRLLLFWFCLSSVSVVAQMLPSKRLEILLDEKKSEDFEVLSLGAQGVLLTKTIQDSYRGISLQYKFARYDSTLTLRWESEFKLKYPYEALLSYKAQEHVYWLCGDRNSDKIQIWKVALESGDVEVIEGEVLAIDEVSQFKVLGNKAFLAGTYNDRPVVVAFSFFDKSSKALPELYDHHLTINQLDVDERNNLVYVFSRLSRRGSCQLQLQTFDYEGKAIRKEILANESGKSLITGKMVPLQNGESLLVGNYSNNCSDYSQGLYLTKLQDQSHSEIKFVPFSELENFFNYLKPSRQEKIKTRIAESKRKGKDPKFNYLLQVHDLIPTNDGYLLVAEAYFPQYKNQNMSASYVTSRPSRRTSGYDSYRYTHALVCGLDHLGNIQWDNSVDLKDLTTDELSQQVQLSSEGDRLRLTYSHDNKVRAVQIQGNKTIGKPREYGILPDDLNRNIDRDTPTSLASWYGPYFLTWGIRKFPSHAANHVGREAFYLYKLEHPQLTEN